MSLIDKQDAIKALRDTFLGGTYEIDEVACKAIENLKPVEAIPVDVIKGFKDMLIYLNVVGNEDVEKIASHYGIMAIDALLDGFNEVTKHEQSN